MNTSLVTTGLVPLVVGSVEVFQLQADLNGLNWDLTGGTVSVIIQDPAGNQTTLPATINSGGGASAQWTVVGPAGNWTRCWVITDAQSVHQVSRPIVFTVTVSP